MNQLQEQTISTTVEELWELPLQPAGCPQCEQVYLIDPARLGQPCPSCGKGRFTAQPALVRPEPPELVVSPKVPRERLANIFNNFTKEVWLRPDDFNPQSLLQRTMAVYWPMWLVDATISGNWQAEMGYDYQVKSSQESYQGGSWHTRELVETRIRWEPRLGQITRRYDNVTVPALDDHQQLGRLLGRYNLSEAEPATPEELGKAIIRLPDLAPANAWPLAQSQLKKAAGEDCTRAAEAQHLRNFTIQAEYDSHHWTQLLLPMYVSYYTDDDGQPQLVYINAQSGAAGGPRLASQRKGWKWAGLLAGGAALMFILAVLSFALTSLLPPLSIVGLLLGLFAFVLAVAAIIPAVWPWQWNRGQQAQKVRVQ